MSLFLAVCFGPSFYLPSFPLYILSLLPFLFPFSSALVLQPEPLRMFTDFVRFSDASGKTQ
jgi:hypothetical protein